MRLYSWNVNGIRAVLKKGFLDWFHEADADIIGLQETKAHPEQLPPELRFVDGYHVEFCAGERKGYSGTAVYSRPKPLSVERGFGLADEFDSEGRILLTRYEHFTLLNIYFPNGESKPERLEYKLRFYDATLTFCEALRARGEKLIVCGDYNTAHHPIDLARPQANEKTSGFLPIERAWLDKWQAHGYVDVFRRLRPEETDRYSWWSFRSGARARNVGWRIDYFWLTEDLWDRVTGAEIHADVMGSDHCPVSVDLDI